MQDKVDAAVDAAVLADQQRRQIMVTLFIPGISDHLRKIASTYNLGTWFTYPGKISDKFTAYRRRLHLSKARHTVYCTQYVAEIWAKI